MQTLEITKEELLWQKISQLHRPFSVVDINHLKEEIFYQRAERTVREWAEQTRIEGHCQYGKLRRIPLEESILRGLILKGRAPLAYWEVI